MDPSNLRFDHDVSLSLQSPVTGTFYPSRALFCHSAKTDSTSTLIILSDLFNEPGMLDQSYITRAAPMCVGVLSYSTRLSIKAGRDNTRAQIVCLPLHQPDGTLTVSAATQMTQSDASPDGSQRYSLTSNHVGNPLLTQWTVLRNGGVTEIQIMGSPEYIDPLLQQIKTAGTDVEEVVRLTAPLMAHLHAQMDMQSPGYFDAFSAPPGPPYQLWSYPSIGQIAEME